MGQSKIKTKRKRFIALMRAISKYSKIEIARFADIRKLK